MPAMILRLMTLVALLLMPFGMGAANASPAHHAPAPAAAAQHCDDHGGQPAEQSPDVAMDCAISCSMLSAAETNIDGLTMALPVINARPLAERDAGLHPDTTTPPPKLS